MKTYVLVETSYGETFIVRCYTSNEDALKDADFIVSQERIMHDDTFRERWIKVGDVWYNQYQNRFETEWPAWEDPEKYSCGRLYVREYNMCELSLKDKFDAVVAWQSRGDVHQLTCGIDSNHPPLIPRISCMNKGIELICPFADADENRCPWHQKYDHPILELIYATYLSHRSQTT